MNLEEDSLISCQNLSLGYGGDVILRAIDLEIPRGVFLPFVGANGAGKTTLLRGILGLIKPLGGVIRTPFDKTPAGYVPQHKAIDPLFPLTVTEIVAMGLYPKLGWWKRVGRSDRNQLDEALEELKLTEHAHKNYRDLSGGTKQKTLIARAFVSGADVFIMDEPTSELDEASEKKVIEHLSEFVRRQGKSVLIAHHGLHDSISSFASHVCLVHQGRVRIMTRNELEAEKF